METCGIILRFGIVNGRDVGIASRLESPAIQRLFDRVQQALVDETIYILPVTQEPLVIFTMDYIDLYGHNCFPVVLLHARRDKFTIDYVPLSGQ